VSDKLSRAYWDGAARGVLVVQQCGNCGKIRHYPRVLCDACWSFEVRPLEVDDRGTVRSWTVTEHAFDPAIAADVPYTLVTVDMAAGVRMLGRFRDGGGSAVRPHEGLPVLLTFEPSAAGRPMPVFTPAIPPEL
jgi:uncharacterized OB-fold protein